MGLSDMDNNKKHLGTLFFLLLISVLLSSRAYGEELLTESELKRCIAYYDWLEEYEVQVDDLADELRDYQLAMDPLDNRLAQIEWELTRVVGYRRTELELEFSNIAFERNQYARSYNSTLDRYRKAKKSYNSKADSYNSLCVEATAETALLDKVCKYRNGYCNTFN